MWSLLTPISYQWFVLLIIVQRSNLPTLVNIGTKFYITEKILAVTNFNVSIYYWDFCIKIILILN